MSQEEVNNNFKFERQKHFDFFLPFYQQKNWQVIKDNIDSGCKNDWDVKLEVFAGEYVLVDEKAISKEYNHCIVEILQDLKTLSPGWLYGEKDWVLYGNWESEVISSLHLIRVGRLREYIFSLDKIIRTAISQTGWGITWNITLEWDELIKRGIVEKLI